MKLIKVSVADLKNFLGFCVTIFYFFDVLLEKNFSLSFQVLVWL